MRDELAESIQIGCLVEVPFHNNLDYAIVTSLYSSKIPENPKSIVRVITSIPLLEPYQIQSILESASYYFVHAHHILSLFLSKSFVRYLEKKDFYGLTPYSSEKKVISENLIHYHHHMECLTFFQMIQERITEKSIIIFPDDFAIDAYIRKCPIDPDTVLVIRDILTQTKKYKVMCAVYNGEKNIII